MAATVIPRGHQTGHGRRLIGSDTVWSQEATRLMRESSRPFYAKNLRNLNLA